MKKALPFFLLFLMILLSLPVCAAESPPFSSPYELISYWDENGYPANVGKPYFDNEVNKVAIPVVWGDASEILPLLQKPNDVFLTTGEYAYRDLQQIANEINALYRTEEYGITSVSVGWGSTGGFGETGKESRVLVTIKLKNYAMTAALLAERYGGCMAFESEQGIAYHSLQELNTHQSIMEREHALPYVLTICTFLPCCLLCLFFYRLHKSKKR